MMQRRAITAPPWATEAYRDSRSELFKMKASRTPALLSWTATSRVAIDM
jgi:hypothetical protein